MIYIMVLAVLLAALGSLFFSILNYSMRDLSRSRLEEYLEQRKRTKYFERIIDQSGDLIASTAILRLLTNVLVLLSVLRIMATTSWHIALQYGAAMIIASVLTLLVSVAIPAAAARYGGHAIVGAFAKLLLAMPIVTAPALKIMHWIDEMVRRAAGASEEPEVEQIEQEILSVVEEGEKEGIVDEQEREMIESVIQFRDTQAGQIMTPRPEIVGMEKDASLEHVKQTLGASGHSRIPIYEGTLDHIVGILHARDLLQHLGLPPEQFNLAEVMRPALFVPETKLLRDLLEDFRLQKVHIAIVLDEYGGTAGLITIEDLLEELVGDIADEHETAEPAMLSRIDDLTFEADARVPIGEFNRVVGLKLPEDAGYETLGGFITTTLGSIPATGVQFEHEGTKFTILDAEPAKVNRVKVELAPPPTAAETPAEDVSATGTGTSTAA